MRIYQYQPESLAFPPEEGLNLRSEPTLALKLQQKTASHGFIRDPLSALIVPTIYEAQEARRSEKEMFEMLKVSPHLRLGGGGESTHAASFEE